MAARLVVLGAPEMAARLSLLASRFSERIPGALYRQGQRIMARSQKEFVPVDLGVLKGSGIVSQPRQEGRQWVVELGFGGAASAYALAIHEHPSEHSPPSWGGQVTFSPPGHGVKYLERPLMEASATFAQDLAADMGEFGQGA